jgi:hypothetical protein
VHHPSIHVGALVGAGSPWPPFFCWFKKNLMTKLRVLVRCLSYSTDNSNISKTIFHEKKLAQVRQISNKTNSKSLKFMIIFFPIANYKGFYLFIFMWWEFVNLLP